MEQTDLLKRAKAGNRDAFDQLVLLYWDRALLFCLRLVGDYFAAEDIVQESFAAFYLNLSAFDHTRPLQPWLFQIIKRRAISYLRKKRPYPTETLPVAADLSAEDRFLSQRSWEELKQAITLLKPSYRTALTLVDCDNFSYQEAAGILGWSQPKLKSTLFRARKALAKKLKENPL